MNIFVSNTRNMLKTRFIILLIGFLAATIFGCKTDPHAINLQGLDPGISISRFEQDLFRADPDSLPESIEQLKEEYGEFFYLFSHRIINLGNPDAKAFPEYLKSFVTDFDMFQLYQEVSRVFPDLSGLEKDLNRAFSRYMYYFPQRPIPAVITFIGGFNQSMATADTLLAIGLDKYLGSENSLYLRMQTAQYLRNAMIPERIATDCMRAWAMTEFDYQPSSDNLISQMIYHGRNLFFVDYMMPEVNDTLKTGFSSAQLEWCIKNEAAMWTYLVERKLLFSTDLRTINRFVGEAPFTTDFAGDSPGRAAVWLGWQIIKSYMKNNRHLSLEELMQEDDFQKILNEARYRPG